MERVTILNLILERCSANLQRHILSYAYRSAYSLICACKTLRYLFLPGNGDVRIWRYGIDRELSTRIAAWPADVRAAFRGTFDPFFDEWPEDMPARPAHPWIASRLSWLWREEETFVRLTQRYYIFRFMVEIHAMRDKLMISTLSFGLSVEQPRRWVVSCEWSQRPKPADYSASSAMPNDSWTFVPGGYYHQLFSNDGIPIIKTSFILADGTSQLCWMNFKSCTTGIRYSTYITRDQLALPGCEAIKRI